MLRKAVAGLLFALLVLALGEGLLRLASLFRSGCPECGVSVQSRQCAARQLGVRKPGWR